MSYQCLIPGDSFVEVKKFLPGTFDLVVFDPPSELDDEEVGALLYDCAEKCTVDASLLFYGINLPRMVRIIDYSWKWKIKRVYDIRHQDQSIAGQIVYANNGYTSRNWLTFEETQGDNVFVQGAKGDEHLHSTKPLDWFEWALDLKWNHVLDPFAGLAPVGQICKKNDTLYTGIEYDPEIYREGLRRLNAA